MNTEEIGQTKKWFSCSYCEYSSDRKSNLSRHERTHKSLKPFKCKYCDKSFSKNQILLDMTEYTQGRCHLNANIVTRYVQTDQIL